MQTRIPHRTKRISHNTSAASRCAQIRTHVVSKFLKGIRALFLFSVSNEGPVISQLLLQVSTSEKASEQGQAEGASTLLFCIMTFMNSCCSAVLCPVGMFKTSS